MTKKHACSRCGIALLLLAALSTAACQKRASSEYAAAGADSFTLAAQNTAMGQPAMAPQSPRRARSATLAYEHTVNVELGKELLPARLKALQAACDADEKHGCTVLDVQMGDADEIPHGTLRMRLAPEGVNAMIETAGESGRITQRSTHAEDLAEPVADTERELALLTTHRGRLEEFLKSKELKFDQLIAVSKELATVQTQIDALSTQRANLRRRIDTELLTISLSVPQRDYLSAQSPILDALRSFGSEFRSAIAEVIRFVAVLLPWLVVIVPGMMLVRLFWRWIGRWLSRREQRTA